FLTPAAFADASARVDFALAAAGRPREALRRSVELDAAIADTRAEAIATVEQFCRRRGITREHPLLQATLAGDVDVIIAQVLAYRKAGATDLMIGFADFPDTTMLERFAARVLPALSARGALARQGRERGRARPGAVRGPAPGTPRARSTLRDRSRRRALRARRRTSRRGSLRGPNAPARGPMRAQGPQSCCRDRPATHAAPRRAAAHRGHTRRRAGRVPAAADQCRAWRARAAAPGDAARPRWAAEVSPAPHVSRGGGVACDAVCDAPCDVS